VPNAAVADIATGLNVVAVPGATVWWMLPLVGGRMGFVILGKRDELAGGVAEAGMLLLDTVDFVPWEVLQAVPTASIAAIAAMPPARRYVGACAIDAIK
jgi:hypothetical protein